MKKADLLTIFENSKSFTVKDIGTFWPLIITRDSSIHYAEFKNIPPHFHKNTEERFHITKGSGSIELGINAEYRYSPPRDTSKYFIKDHSEEIYPGAITDIPRYIPHRMIRDESCEYVGTLLTCWPPLDPKDEIGLRVRSKKS